MQYRDLLLLPGSAERTTVVACDVCASIGEKELDVLRCPPNIVAAMTLRVVLFELLAYGAQVDAIVFLVGNESAVVGQAVRAGLMQELARAGLPDVPITGSTEDNMTSRMTCVGLTALGSVPRDYAPTPLAPGDEIFRVGTPYVGEDVLKHADEIVSYESLWQLRDLPGVIDILPIGSRGTRYETEEMVRTSPVEVSFLVTPDTLPDLEHSAGPVTAILVGVKCDAVEAFTETFPDAVRIARCE